MSLILLVEQEGPMAEQVRRALTAEGRRVEVAPGAPAGRSFARQHAPELVLVGEVEGRSELLVELSSRGGGPGALALVREGVTSPPEVDGRLQVPCSDEEIRLSVRGCLARLKGQAARSVAAKAASAGDQLTSQQLFGEVLAEVEREVGGKPAQTSPPAKASAPPSPRRDEVDRKLEQTLSGVLGTAASPKPAEGSASARSRAPRPDTGVDDLLNKTLSGLGMGPKHPGRAEAKAAPSRPLPAAPQPPPPPSSPEPVAPEPPPPVTEAVAEEAPAEAPRTAPARPPTPQPEASPRESAAPRARVAPVAPAPEPPPVAPDSPALPATAPPLEAPAAGTQAKEAYETQRMAAISEPPADKSRDLGPYTLLERVAVGGMAEVWKARMQGVEGFQKTVAIKRILPQLTDSVEFVTMFIDEAKLAAQLNHPHIIHIYDLGKLEDDYYIAMEYVEGKDLRSILEAGRVHNRPLPMGLALLTASRLASALDHAHRKRGFDDRELGLVHRDVSPQNVLISYEGDIKLCDFGIVKAVAKASKTQMGALKGKLQYMSPEQAWGRVVDSRSDIFSLGAVLFEMLTGERLFAGDSEISVLEAVREARTRRPREIDPSLPEEVERILTRALARDPEDRYQSAGELQKELDALLYGIKPAPSQGDLARYMGELFAAEGVEIPVARPREEPALPAAGAAAAAPPGPSSSAASQELEAVAPAPGFDGVREERQASWGLWAAAAAALAVLLAGGLFAYRSLGERPEAAPEMATVEALEPRGGRAAESQPAPLEEEADFGDPGAASDLDLERLVDSELRPREEEMQRQFEEERQRLERELEQVEVPPAPSQVDETPSPVTQPTPEATAPTPPETTPAPASEVAAAPPAEEEATQAPSRELPAPDAGAVAAAQPPPVAVEPPPSPAPEAPTAPEATAPARPAVREGDLVDITTPGLAPPRRLEMRQPSYPPQARRMGREGTVVVRVLVDERGRVLEAELAGEEAGFGMDQAALSAARTARYDPATVEDIRVRVWVTLTFPFRL